MSDEKEIEQSLRAAEIILWVTGVLLVVLLAFAAWVLSGGI